MPDGRVLVPAIYALDSEDELWVMNYCKYSVTSIPAAEFLPDFCNNEEPFGNDTWPYDGEPMPPVDLRDVLGVISDNVSTLWLGEVALTDPLSAKKAVFSAVLNYV